MRGQYSIKLKKIVETHNLSIVHQSSDYEKISISNYSASRPSLQVVGFYDYFEADRLRIWGKAEDAFLRRFPEEEQERIINDLFSRKIPALIVCNRVIPNMLIVNAAKKYDISVLATDMDTSEFFAQLINTLRKHLAARTQEHGVLVQVHGEGVLIMGESGIGKSEVALELVKRGHRLVADDAVEIRRMSPTTVEGCAPKSIRYLMELRGVGIIDIHRIYGVGAVLPHCKVDLVVQFVRWDDSVVYDRLGVEDETISFLGVDVPHITVPVAPARNLAIIIEVAAMNNREKKLGHNTAQDFINRHDAHVDAGWDDDDDDFDD